MNKEQFTQIYKENFKRVFRYFFKRVNRVVDVEDLTSEVFESIYKVNNLDSVDIEKYIFGIARNKLRDYLRKRYRIEYNLLSWDDFEESYWQSESNKRRDMTPIIKELVKELGESDKKLFKYKYIDNLNNIQISKELDISKNNVKVRNNRLIKKLKELWIKSL